MPTPGRADGLPLVTDRLLLRPYEDRDVDAVHGVHSREEVTRFLPWGPRGLAEARAMVERRKPMTALARDGDGVLLVIELVDSGAVVGDVDLQLVSLEHHQGEVGYVVHPDHHGRGYATEAVGALLRLGFERYDLHRIVGRLDARNRASARVLERLGMRLEAHFRENEYLKGEWTDEQVYAILADEWRGRG